MVVNLYLFFVLKFFLRAKYFKSKDFRQSGKWQEGLI